MPQEGLVYIKLTIYGQSVLVLTDSGPSRSVVWRNEFIDLCKAVGRSPILKKSVQLVGVTGHDIKVKGSTQFPVKFVGPLELIVVEDINHPIILGRDNIHDIHFVFSPDD